MKTYSLNSDIVAEIVTIVADKLEVVSMDLEQREVLTDIVALSVALYFKMITESTDSGMVQ
jgi:hypothetical protein